MGNVRIGPILSVLILCGAAAAARAQAISAFNLPSQPLAESLKAIGSQTNTNVLVAPELVDGRQAPALKATLNVDEALSRILAGTGINHKFLNEKTIVLASAASPKSSAIAGADDSTERPAGEQAEEAQNKSFWDRFRLAQLDQGKTSSEASVERQDEQASEKKPVQLEEVIVTGSRIPQAAKEGAQDVKVYAKQQIEQSGQATVADFLNTLPDVSVAIAENGHQTFGGSSTVQLHGLPIGATLVLLNGRRVETSGSQARSDFFDLNNIPLAAVDRIEVLANGSSAVYGSDAIAGVVNILLKRTFNGLEASARYGAAADADEWNTSLALGKQWDRGALTIVASYQNRSQLLLSKRRLTQSNDYRAYGGTDANINDCNPGNVFSLDGVTPLPGLGTATYAAVPRGFTGTPSIQEFSGTVGTLNECGVGFGNTLIPASRRTGVFAQGDYALTPSVELFSELLYSYVRQFQSGGYNPLDGAPGFQQFTVSAANPYNPFGTTVGISGLFTSVPVWEIFDTDFFRPLVGARGTLFSRWGWEISAWQSRDYTKNHEPALLPDNTAIQNALNSPDPATALNPFVAGPYGSPQLLQSFFSEALTTFTGLGQALEGYVRGPALRLPAGAIELLIGGEYDLNKVSFDAVNDGFDPPNTRSSHQRHSYAVFGEARIPIIGNHGTREAGDTLAATVAGRHDHFDDFGSKNTPQFGAEWRPLNTVLIRATYAEAFKAPALQALHSPRLLLTGRGVDPLTGQTVLFPLLLGGNPQLQPETGASHTLGLVWSSEAIPDLQLSITQWKVRETNAIQRVPAAVILANEDLFPGRVVRDSTGHITLVDDRTINFGNIDVAGLDYQLHYRVTTRFGIWTPSISASQTYRYSAALTPRSPAVNAVSTAQDSGNWAPRWKGTFALGWKLGAYAANFDGRYVGPYQDYDSTHRIGNFWLCDANVRYAAGETFASNNSFLKGSYIEVGGVNLFNRPPQFSNVYFDTFGYDPAQADIRGRFLYAQLGIKW